MKPAIYLDFQATTPLDAGVRRAMQNAWEATGNAHSVDHYCGWQAAKVVEQAQGQIARFLGVDADEVLITSGATEANNLALLGLGRRAAANGSKRRVVLIGATEHSCVMEAARTLVHQLGYEVREVPVDGQGRVVMEALEQALTEEVLLLSLMLVNNEVGTIQDLAQVSALAKERGVVLHTDAAQAPCALPLRSVAGQVDMLALSAHKAYGPMGVGCLFVRRDLQGEIEPLIYGGGQQGGLRSGTVPVALCAGFGQALEILGRDEEAEAERRQVAALRDRLVAALTQLPWQVAINGPPNECRHPGNANLRFEGFAAEDVLQALQPQVAASTGSACTSGIPEPSRVLRALGLSDEQAASSIRFSLGRGTTEAQIDEAASRVAQVLDRLAHSGAAQAS